MWFPVHLVWEACRWPILYTFDYAPEISAKTVSWFNLSGSGSIGLAKMLVLQFLLQRVSETLVLFCLASIVLISGGGAFPPPYNRLPAALSSEKEVEESGLTLVKYLLKQLD